MQVGRDGLVLQRQDRFDDTCDAGRGFQMSNICFDRAQPTAFTAGTIGRKHRAQRIGLNWIARLRSCAMRFGILDLVR